MSNPVCISPLKFYDSPAKQNHRKSYAYGHISPLITKTGWIPAFQFVIPARDYINGGSQIAEVILYDAKIEKAISNISVSNIVVETIENFKVCYFKGNIKLEEFNCIIPSFTITTGYYINSGGYKVPLGSYGYTSPIPVTAGQVISVRHPDGTASVAIISTVNSDGTNIRPKALGGATAGTATYTVEEDGYICICSYNDRLTSTYISIHCSVQEGLYYLKIASGNNGIWTYYSEVFCFDNVTKDCLELEYWNETGNFAIKNGIIAFPNGFHFKLLLKTEIGKPEYNFEEESTKRLGYVFVESQVSKKTYKFNVVVPEYICDALRLVRLCDNKIVRCKDDEYEAITFEMEAEWQTQGDLASVTCEFETDNVVANIGGFVPDKLGGDYNNDYNKDFDKE